MKRLKYILILLIFLNINVFASIEITVKPTGKSEQDINETYKYLNGSFNRQQTTSNCESLNNKSCNAIMYFDSNNSTLYIKLSNQDKGKTEMNGSILISGSSEDTLKIEFLGTNKLIPTLEYGIKSEGVNLELTSENGILTISNENVNNHFNAIIGNDITVSNLLNLNIKEELKTSDENNYLNAINCNNLNIVDSSSITIQNGLNSYNFDDFDILNSSAIIGNTIIDTKGNVKIDSTNGIKDNSYIFNGDINLKNVNVFILNYNKVTENNKFYTGTLKKNVRFTINDNGGEVNLTKSNDVNVTTFAELIDVASDPTIESIKLSNNLSNITGNVRFIINGHDRVFDLNGYTLDMKTSSTNNEKIVVRYESENGLTIKDSDIERKGTITNTEPNPVLTIEWDEDNDNSSFAKRNYYITFNSVEYRTGDSEKGILELLSPDYGTLNVNVDNNCRFISADSPVFYTTSDKSAVNSNTKFNLVSLTLESTGNKPKLFYSIDKPWGIYGTYGKTEDSKRYLIDYNKDIAFFYMNSNNQYELIEPDTQLSALIGEKKSIIYVRKILNDLNIKLDNLKEKDIYNGKIIVDNYKDLNEEISYKLYYSTDDINWNLYDNHELNNSNYYKFIIDLKLNKDLKYSFNYGESNLNINNKPVKFNTTNPFEAEIEYHLGKLEKRKLKEDEVESKIISGNQIELSWENTATSYILYRSTTGKKGSWKSIYKGFDTNYIDKVSYNTKYYYRIFAYSDSNYKTSLGYTDFKSRKISLSKPVVTLESLTLNSLKISYTGSTIATGYHIQRSLSKNSGYQSFGLTNPSKNIYTDLEFTDNNLVYNKKYYYRVRSYIKVGSKIYYSSWSDVKSYNNTLAKPKLTKDTSDILTNKISWNSIKYGEKYEVYRSLTGKKGSYVLLVETNDLEYIDSDIENSKDYYYNVFVYNGTNKVYSSITVNNSISKPVVKVEKNTIKTLKISFNEVEKANYYEIYRSTKNKTGTWTKIATIEDTVYIDSDCKYNTVYYYKVRAHYDIDHYSKMSSSKYNRITIQKPTFEIKQYEGYNTIRVKNYENELSYKIYRSTSKTKNFKLIGTINGDTYFDTFPKKGQKYYYRVVATYKYNNKNYTSGYYVAYKVGTYTKEASLVKEIRKVINDFNTNNYSLVQLNNHLIELGYEEEIKNNILNNLEIDFNKQCLMRSYQLLKGDILTLNDLYEELNKEYYEDDNINYVKENLEFDFRDKIKDLVNYYFYQEGDSISLTKDILKGLGYLEENINTIINSMNLDDETNCRTIALKLYNDGITNKIDLIDRLNKSYGYDQSLATEIVKEF